MLPARLGFLPSYHNLGLFDKLCLNLRGDGRRYLINIRVSAFMETFSRYQYCLQTNVDKTVRPYHVRSQSVLSDTAFG